MVIIWFFFIFYFKLVCKFQILTGIVMNLIGFIVIFIASNLWLNSIFDLQVFDKFNNLTEIRNMSLINKF
jgi:hypothetical protein